MSVVQAIFEALRLMIGAWVAVVVIGAACYLIATVAYNVYLRKRRRETEPRPKPDVRKRIVVYPSDREVREK